MAETSPTAEETRAAIASARVGIWSFDIATGRVAWSPEVEQLFGVAPGQFGGTIEAYLALHTPTERERVKQLIERAIAARAQHFTLDHWLVPHDGSPRRWLEVWGRVLLDSQGLPVGMAGAMIDGSARKESEARLADKLHELDLVAQLSTDYVYEVDMARPHLFPRIVAGSFERTTGFTPAQVERAGGWVALIHKDDQAQVAQVFEELGKGKPIVSEYRIHDGHGGVRWLRDRIMPVVEAGKVVRLVGGVQDFTQVKTLELQLQHAQKMEALAHLSGAVAHDFNNLLTVMQAAAVELADGSCPPSRRDDASADLNEALDRAAGLTRSLLAFGRRQTGLLEPLSLKAAIEGSCGILRRALGEQVQLEVTFADEVATVQTRGDKGQLELVLLNLVINARDAAPRDAKVEIRVEITELGRDNTARPPELEPGTYLEVRVSDRGQGMAPETQVRIFEPFFTTKGPGKGTGLGLSTVYGVVRAWRGGVHVTSKLGQGTSMHIFLPILGTRVAPKHETRARTGTVGGTERILLVDDEGLILRTTRRALEDHGYEVLAYGSADQLLAELEGVAPSAQLLLSDVRMPGRDGVSLAAEVRERFPHIKVLLMSGHVAAEEQVEQIAAGDYVFLPKPFSVEGLARRVREVLD